MILRRDMAVGNGKPDRPVIIKSCLFDTKQDFHSFTLSVYICPIWKVHKFIAEEEDIVDIV